MPTFIHPIIPYALYALYSVGSLYSLWVFYLAIMNLKRAHDAGTLSKLTLALGMPMLVVGLLIDLVVNVLVATVVMLELPRELTVSDRMSRLVKRDKGWRKTGACWFCQHFLDVFDPSGKHCK